MINKVGGIRNNCRLPCCAEQEPLVSPGLLGEGQYISIRLVSKGRLRVLTLNIVFESAVN